MNNLAKYVALAACFMVLIVTGALMNTRHAVAQAPTPVTVMNTPLPVTGNFHIAASAHQPLQVQFAHTPTVGLVPGTTVLVGNTPGSLSVRNADEPGRAPFQQSLSFVFGSAPCSTNSCSLIFTPVPAGYRLVMQHLSLQLSLPNPVFPFPVVLGSPAPSFVFINVIATKQGSGALDYYVASQSVQGYVDSGSSPFVNVFTLGGPPGGAVQSISLTGYYVAVP